MNVVTMDVDRRIVKISKESQLSRSLSRSTPSLVACVPNTPSLSASTISLSTSTITARQRKFHRCFSQVPTAEGVLYHYRCALVREILLQGHLYITPNYFAFYSNVLGYVNKLLIPMTSVIEINKEKIAKIIPNAIGITTEETKHVFCSLFWKESSINLMKQVWSESKESTPAGIDRQLSDSENYLDDHSEEDLDEENSNCFHSETDHPSRPSTVCTDADGFSARISRLVARIAGLQGFFRTGTIIAILVVLLAALYVSAALMMARIDRLHTVYVNHQLVSSEFTMRNYISQYLQRNLDQIAKMRHNLQLMSQQLVSMTEGADEDVSDLQPTRDYDVT